MAHEPLTTSTDNTLLSNSLHSIQATTNIQGTAPSDQTTASTDARVANHEIKPRVRGALSWPVLVISVLSSTFLFALDNTMVANIQPTIIETFGEVEKLPWLSVAFQLGALGASLLW